MGELEKIVSQPLIACEVDTDLVKEFWDKMDSLDNYPEGFVGRPFKGPSVLRILAEYAATAHKCSWAPEETALAVVVWPPEVYFCPSMCGINGAFLEPYHASKHGEYAYKIQKGMDIWAYSNIEATRDGWDFNAAMVSASIHERMGRSQSVVQQNSDTNA